MSLVNGSCVCDDIGLINLDGLCSCWLGEYYAVSAVGVKECVKCPEYCFTCQSVENGIQCLSCNTSNTHRLNVTDGYCPC